MDSGLNSIHKTNFWQSNKYIWIRLVNINVRNEQFDVHLTLVVKCCTINKDQGKSKIEYYYMG